MIWVRRGAKKYEKATRSYKQFYRCKLVKARSKVQCSSGCYIILNANNTNAEIYSTSCPHDHSGKVLSVSIEARIEIDKMFKVISRIKPKTILSNLEKINASILQENSKMREDPCRRNEKENSFIDNRDFDRFFEVPASSNALTYANLTTTNEASLVQTISNSISNFDARVDSVQSNSNNQEALTVSNVLPAIKRGRGRPPLTAEEKLKRCNYKALLNPLAKKSKKK